MYAKSIGNVLQSPSSEFDKMRQRNIHQNSVLLEEITKVNICGGY